MGLNIDILTKSKSAVDIRRIFQHIQTKLIDTLGSMALQDKDNVDIIGGTIEGTDIDVTGQTLTLDDQQIDTAKIGTSETDTSKVLVPDGIGGVEFAVNSGDGQEPVTVERTLRLWDGSAEYNEDWDLVLTDSSGNVITH